MAKKKEEAYPVLKLPEGMDPDDERIIRTTYTYRQEAYEAKRDRMQLNRVNFDTYNLKGDFSHKKRGQSREFLPKQAMAVENIKSFFHQALLDVGTWFSMAYSPGIENLKITPREAQLLTLRQLEKVKFNEDVVDSLGMGLLGSLMIMKIHGEYVDAPVFYTEDDLGPDGLLKSRLFRSNKKVWQLKIDLIRQEDWFPDPTNTGLYKVQQLEMDLHKVKLLSQGPNAIYDPAVVDQLTGGFEDQEQVARKARETAQNQTFTSFRKRVRIWECWGNILDPSTGELLHENVTWTVANDRYLIQKPTKYPFWHGSHPFIEVPIIRGASPDSVWHKALMDAPTNLNLAMNELFNLCLDSGLMAAFGIRQFRPDWMADEGKASDGFAAGDSIEVNSSCPPGGKVLESVQNGSLSPEALQMFNVATQEFNQSAATNDLRQGSQPQREVSATSVVEASQSITSLFTGITRVIESNFIVAALEKIWLTIAQNADDLDSNEVQALLGKDKALEIKGMTPEQRFAETAQGFKFKVFGISLILSKMKNYKKLTSLLQTIAGAPALMEEFVKKYDMGKLLSALMKALDIDTEDLEVDSMEQQAMKQMAAQGGAPVPQPNQQSQIAQVQGMGDESNPGGPQPAEGGIPQAHFPPSKASGA